MRLSIAAFILGVIWLQQQPGLPALHWAGLLPLLATATWLPKAGWLATLRRGLILLLFLAAGFLWAAWRADLRLSDALPPAWEGRDIEIVGVIAGLPEGTPRGWAFPFDVERVTTPGARAPKHISLNRYDYEFANHRPLPHAGLELRAGERWRFKVRLKRPHGQANPHGSDSQARWLEENIRGLGHIVRPEEGRRLDLLVVRPTYLIERLRQGADRHISQTLDDEPYAGVIRALAVGNQAAISEGLWRLFRHTGVVHLMSISGLHVTLLGGLLFGLTAFIWRRVPALALRVPTRRAAILAGLGGAGAYALLAGFGVPAQRTLYMLAIVALALWLNRVGSPSRVLVLAAFIVILVDPWAVLSPGFWLSFGAVAAIFYATAHRLEKPAQLRLWSTTQWAVTLALLPGLLLLFREVSLVSPVANAFAIPVVSLLVVPLSLAGAISGVEALLHAAHSVMAACGWLLQGLLMLPGAVWRQHEPPLWAAAFGLLGVLWLLLPRGFPARWLGGLLFLPLFLNKPGPLAHGAFAADVLDVGQGLAVTVRTRSHTLLFDAGPDYAAESDAGSRVVLPHLIAEGVTGLGGLIVSHDDTDHSGGAMAILKDMQPGWLLASLPPFHPAWRGSRKSLPCGRGQHWQWDGVDFEILHPAPLFVNSSKLNDNEKSCVLRISSRHGSLLIPADIERLSEMNLLERVAEKLPADVLVAPHHGSLTSSTAAFVEAIEAKAVIFTVGHRNGFGHPKPEVLRRYRERGCATYRTDRDGAVLLRFESGGLRLTAWRRAHRRYWQE
jgi:competence protein ComEC